MSTDDTLTPSNLARLVTDKIAVLGEKEAAAYFGVKESTITRWRHGTTEPPLSAAQRVWDESFLCASPEVWGATDPKHIALLLPMYESLEPITFFTLLRSIKLYGMENVTVIPRWRTLIVEARNDLAEKALLTPHEWFVYGDADSVLPCGSVGMAQKVGLTTPAEKAGRNALTRLMSHPPDKLIVGGLYKDRRGGTKAQCASAFQSPQENARLLGLFDGTTKADGLEKQGWIGFGLVRIHRSVFERMKAEAKPGGLMEEIMPPPGREKEPYGYFDTTRAQRGEDVKFCRRAGQLGIDVWLDTGLLLGHIGKTCYS